MEWHSGRLLSHTVFTLIYIHELPNIETGQRSNFFTLSDPLRPIELITTVLSPAVQGLIKCCDLAWRELSTGGMLDVCNTFYHDTNPLIRSQAEDWQSDKCEVSLLEGLPTSVVNTKLNDALSWIVWSNKSLKQSL